MNAREDEALSAVREAMQGYDWRLEAVLTFTHGVAVQVYQNVGAGRAKWVKVGPLLFPPDGGTLADTLAVLATAPATTVGAHQ